MELKDDNVKVQFLTLTHAIEHIVQTHGEIDHIQWDPEDRQLVFFNSDMIEICGLMDESRDLDSCKDAISIFIDSSEDRPTRSWMEGWVTGLHTVHAISDYIKDQLMDHIRDLVIEGIIADL